jgi:hypothetical protein
MQKYITVYEVGCNTDIDQYRNVYLSPQPVADYEYSLITRFAHFSDLINYFDSYGMSEYENIQEFLIEALPLFNVKWGSVK